MSVTPVLVDWKIQGFPDPVGGYDIGGVIFQMTRKPSWPHRLAARWLLGWEWRDK